MENIIIEMKSSIQQTGEAEETMELITEGRYYKKEHARYLVYEETALMGSGNTTVTIKITDNMVTMKKFGEINAKLVFEIGRVHASKYGTPHGTFNMETNARVIDVTLDEKGKGSLKLEYDLEILGLSNSYNKLYIIVK